MLSIINVSKNYNSKIVLCNIPLTIGDGIRAGLVGANGCGKTTLLKIIRGFETPDAGKVVRDESLIIGYLPQILAGYFDMTIEEFLFSHMSGISLEERDNNDHIVSEIASGLGIGYLDRSQRIDSLSGGEKTRISLATILLQSPDLLLLDEPTNNLDLASLSWLEKYLNSFNGGILIASHDREFLNNVVSVIFEIDEYSHGLSKYAGNYDAYKLAKDKERREWETAYYRQQEEIKDLRQVIKQTADASSHHRKFTKDHDKCARSHKEGRRERATSRTIQAAAERLERILGNPIMKPPKLLSFNPDVGTVDIRSDEVIRVDGISKKYGSKTILCDVSLILNHQSRILIMGSNGAGKTTFLQILIGRENIDEGNVKYAPSARLGYLPQEPEIDGFDGDLVSYWLRNCSGSKNDAIYYLITCGLFRYEELFQKVKELSLGQIRKLQIAALIAAVPNVLILDEPTNHLSLDVMESFEAAIEKFQGPVVAVSHDRRFKKRFGGEIWELNEGKLQLTYNSSAE